jgi:hypothetical protein
MTDGRHDRREGPGSLPSFAGRWGLLLAAGAVWWLIRPARRHLPLTPTTLADGLGPVVERRFWADIVDARHSAQDTVDHAADFFPALMPRPLAFVWKVSGRPGHAVPGDRYAIVLAARLGATRLQLRGPLRFREQTLRHHPESGWVEFRAVPQDVGRARLEIETCTRSSTRMDRLGYLLGASYVQRRTWELFLERVAASTGGRVVGTGHTTEERPYVAGSSGNG